METTSMASHHSSANNDKMRVFFIPFFATGHILPMVDLCCLFARHHVEPNLVLTPANADIVRPSLDRTKDSGIHVNVLTFPFPDVGLPRGVENLATAPSTESWRILRAAELCHDVLTDILHHHRPGAVVGDIFFRRTAAIAAELGIPWITYHCIGLFAQLGLFGLINIREQLHLSYGDALVALPGLPIEIPVSEMPSFMRNDNQFARMSRIFKAQKHTSYGVVVNRFHRLEPDYCDRYCSDEAKRAWFVGPLVLATNSRYTGDNECLRWLDGQKKMSVLYVCFGSWCFFEEAQLHEMAAGLEASGQPFLWVLRDKDVRFPTGWEERVAGRGMVVREFAPQVAILDHPSVGAFMSHCGWNAVLEAVAAGVPMLTWPLFFEQFISERLVVEVLGMGRRVWDEPRREGLGPKPVVPSEAIGRVVKEFFEDWREAAAAKAEELAAAARAAVGEGGSSKSDLNCLIDELLNIWQEGKGKNI